MNLSELALVGAAHHKNDVGIELMNFVNGPFRAFHLFDSIDAGNDHLVGDCGRFADDGFVDTGLAVEDDSVFGWDSGEFSFVADFEHAVLREVFVDGAVDVIGNDPEAEFESDRMSEGGFSLGAFGAQDRDEHELILRRVSKSPNDSVI